MRSSTACARALQAELTPRGHLQTDLVSRIALAAWRARRADQLEAGVLGSYLDDPAADPDPRAALATGLTRDSYGPGVFATLVRYRGSMLAELFRSLAALKLLQAEARGPCAPGRGVALPAATERTRGSLADQRLGAPPPG